LREKLRVDVECIEADLLDRAQIEKLPKSPNVCSWPAANLADWAEYLT
jgi:hypothetical protein